MKLNLPNDKFKVEGIDPHRLGQILQMTTPRYEYLITDGLDDTNNISFADEQDWHDFRQTLKFYKHL